MDINEVRKKYLNPNKPVSPTISKSQPVENNSFMREKEIPRQQKPREEATQRQSSQIDDFSELNNVMSKRIIEMPVINYDYDEENQGSIHGGIVEQYRQESKGVPAIAKEEVKGSDIDMIRASSIVPDEKYLEKLDNNITYQLALVPEEICKILKEIIPVPMNDILNLKDKKYVLVEVETDKKEK